jgi:transcriptional regulator GlxA family with amidase domain
LRQEDGPDPDLEPGATRGIVRPDLARHDVTGGRAPASDAQVFGFLLVPQFSLLAFSSALEPLRAANRASGRRLYDWHVISEDGGPVTASSGVTVMCDTAMAATPRLHTAVVASGRPTYPDQESRATSAWLRRQARLGVRLGALSTGTYALARAGLIDSARVTIHWQHLSAFAETYPHIEVTDELFEVDGNRITCSGGEAALDMMLALIALDHGRELATQVAENFIHERIRDTGDPQRMALRTRLGISHPKLLSVIEIMEENLEEPLPRAELAERVGLSPRQLERLCRKYLGRTPTRYYQELRLYRARTLLHQTSMSILDVALACGFVSASHFSKCYREFFTRTPRQERAARTYPVDGAPGSDHPPAPARAEGAPETCDPALLPPGRA